MKCVALGSLLLAAAACGPKSAPANAVLPDVPFEQLDHDQKIQFMKESVVPTMAPLFQAHDGEKFADFGCKTCHGEAADRGHFHMPNDKLPKLNLADMSKYKQRDIDFMANEIKPTMAKLLREPEYSEAEPQGFGCLHCHAKAVP
jgi:cytochrome c551/c552